MKIKLTLLIYGMALVVVTLIVVMIFRLGRFLINTKPIEALTVEQLTKFVFMLLGVDIIVFGMIILIFNWAPLLSVFFEELNKHYGTMDKVESWLKKKGWVR